MKRSSQMISTKPSHSSALDWKPEKEQRRGVKWLVDRPYAGLVADPGVGKTSMALAALQQLKKQDRLEGKVLVVASAKICQFVWRQEAAKWKQFADLRVEVLLGNKKQEALERDADIYCISPETLPWLLEAEKTTSVFSGKKLIRVDASKFARLGFRHLIIDELRKFKDPQAQRSKILKTVHNTFATRWGLTGSLTANGLMDLFGEMLVLDGGYCFGPFITRYRLAYFTPGHDGFSWNIQNGAEEKIYKKVAPFLLRISDAHLSVPRFVPVLHKFDLPSSARSAYDEMEKELFFEVEKKGVVFAANKGVALNKCRQITAGGLYVDENFKGKKKDDVHVLGQRRWLKLHNEKAEQLFNVAEELNGSPLWIGFDYKFEVELLRTGLKKCPALGEGSEKQNAALLQSWNRGELPVLCGHPGSVGHGLNMQSGGCNHTGWMTIPWDYELFDQFNRRVRRQGNAAPVVRCHMPLASDTIDETMPFLMQAKENNQQRGYALLEEYWKKRRR